jgi:hypothetical protein
MTRHLTEAANAGKPRLAALRLKEVDGVKKRKVRQERGPGAFRSNIHVTSHLYLLPMIHVMKPLEA